MFFSLCKNSTLVILFSVSAPRVWAQSCELFSPHPQGKTRELSYNWIAEYLGWDLLEFSKSDELSLASDSQNEIKTGYLNADGTVDVETPNLTDSDLTLVKEYFPSEEDDNLLSAEQILKYSYNSVAQIIPQASPGIIKEILKTTSSPTVNHIFWNSSFGVGTLNAYNAIQTANDFSIACKDSEKPLVCVSKKLQTLRTTTPPKSTQAIDSAFELFGCNDLNKAIDQNLSCPTQKDSFLLLRKSVYRNPFVAKGWQTLKCIHHKTKHNTQAQFYESLEHVTNRDLSLSEKRKMFSENLKSLYLKGQNQENQEMQSRALIELSLLGPESAETIQELLNDSLSYAIRSQLNNSIFFILNSLKALTFAHAHSPEKILALDSKLNLENNFEYFLLDLSDKNDQIEPTPYKTHADQYLESYINFRKSTRAPLDIERFWVRHPHARFLNLLLDSMPEQSRLQRLSEYSRSFRESPPEEILFEGIKLLTLSKKWSHAAQIQAYTQVAILWLNLNLSEIDDFYLDLSQVNEPIEQIHRLQDQLSKESQEELLKTLTVLQQKLLNKEKAHLEQFELERAKQNFKSLSPKEIVDLFVKENETALYSDSIADAFYDEFFITLDALFRNHFSEPNIQEAFRILIQKHNSFRLRKFLFKEPRETVYSSQFFRHWIVSNEPSNIVKLFREKELSYFKYDEEFAQILFKRHMPVQKLIGKILIDNPHSPYLNLETTNVEDLLQHYEDTPYEYAALFAKSPKSEISFLLKNRILQKTLSLKSLLEIHQIKKDTLENSLKAQALETYPLTEEILILTLNLADQIPESDNDTELSRFETLVINILNNPSLFYLSESDANQVSQVAFQKIDRLSFAKDSMAHSLVWYLVAILGRENPQILSPYFNAQPRMNFVSLRLKHVSEVSDLASEMCVKYFEKSGQSDQYFLPPSLEAHPFANRFKNIQHLIGVGPASHQNTVPLGEVASDLLVFLKSQ